MKNIKKNKAFVKPSGAKQTNFYGHVGVGKSTNNVVESSKSPVIMGFFHAPNTSEYALDTFLGTFCRVSKRYLDTLFKSKIAIF